MKKVLFMHTGSKNHGCEAIVKTSSMILGKKDSILWSFNKSEDLQYGVDEFYEKIVESEEIKKFSYSYFKTLFLRKIFNRKDAMEKEFIKNTFKGNVAISVGGDNYCYPWSAKQAVELDHEIRKHCTKSVLWGCSINEDAITDDLIDDLSKFDLITAREQYTYELLKKINKNTVKVADPAFLLPLEESIMPKEFKEYNTVGINVSPLIMKYTSTSNMVLENYSALMNYIIDNTDMNICLIPHVTWNNNDDLIPILELYNSFKNTGRVCYIDDTSCSILKGYISKCRFFIGARTHATIAAYSTKVPTLVIGYSIKSKGIAKDLFGNDENYVIPVNKLINSDDLLNKFKWIMCNESNIKEQLEKVIPLYKEEAKKSIVYFNKMINGESLDV